MRYCATHVDMAQRSVTTQTTLPKPKRLLFHYRWMRHFFTEDQSSSSRPIAELQRRACWIALALLFQSTNEINRDVYLPWLGSIGAVIVGSLLPPALILASFYAIWMAVKPAKNRRVVSLSPTTPPLWQRIILILTFLLIIPGLIECGTTVVRSFLAPDVAHIYSNDGTSLDTNAAILLLQGKNPYTDSTLPVLVRRFSIDPSWTTPLRLGQFADRLEYPSTIDMKSILATSLKAGNMPEFEARVSYPALSFLTLVPFTLLGNTNVLPFYLLCYLLLVGIAWKVARVEIRPWVLLLGLANVPMWASTMGGNLDIFYILLVVLAWWLRDHRWSSPFFYGLAIASKQIAWYFAPFYAIMIWRHYGFREAVRRLLIAGIIGLLINLPFILWNWQAWLQGVMAPIADPMFPDGIGLVNLSTNHLLPFYLPEKVYSILEYLGMIGAMIWYWKICRKRPEAAMWLAVMPLFLAWRSLPSYFYCIAFPVFIVTAARVKPISHRVLAMARLRKLTEEAQKTTAPLAQPVSIG